MTHPPLDLVVQVIRNEEHYSSVVYVVGAAGQYLSTHLLSAVQ